jgi:hypothetical protein
MSPLINKPKNENKKNKRFEFKAKLSLKNILLWGLIGFFILSFFASIFSPPKFLEDKPLSVILSDIKDFGILKDLRLPDHIPKDIRCRMDSGFQGFEREFPGHAVSMPTKKPKGRPLCRTFKEQNRRKSRIRVLVEHAIGGVKRFQAVADVFRSKREGADDHAMVIACGLWNYHLAHTS